MEWYTRLRRLPPQNVIVGVQTHTVALQCHLADVCETTTAAIAAIDHQTVNVGSTFVSGRNKA